jgi:Fe-S-cluster containining protein
VSQHPRSLPVIPGTHPALDAVPDCQDCGACCHADTPRYVRVSGDDYARLGDDAASMTVFEGNRCYMRMHEGHCASLVRAPSGRFACGSYATRPEPCRDLERGSTACDAERLRKLATP